MSEGQKSKRTEDMSTAVRYYSRGGNTKAMAEAIAKAAGVEAVSVDAAGALAGCGGSGTAAEFAARYMA